MISHHHRCIFVHQRKAAGLSVIAAFGALGKAEKNYLNKGVLSRHWSLHNPYLTDYFTFSVVRNPWDRFISGWKYCESTRNKPIEEVLENLPQDGHDFRHLTQLQSDVLYPPEGKLAVQQLMRFETLQQDFDAVCDRIGMAHTELMKANSTEARQNASYRELFTPRAKALFEAHYGRDIELFGYQF